MTPAVAYLRVSGKGQAMDDRDGYPRQLAAVRSFAKGRYEIVEVYEEAYTGTDEDRPEFTRMVARLLGNGVKTVLVESCDRLARDAMVQHQLIVYLASKGLTLVSAATGQDVTAAFFGNPMQRAMIQMQAVFAELERRTIVARLKSGLKRKRARDGWCEGRKRYGARKGEGEVVELICKLRRKRGGERMSLQAIADWLNDGKVPTRYGNPWQASTVRSILKARGKA